MNAHSKAVLIALLSCWHTILQVFGVDCDRPLSANNLQIQACYMRLEHALVCAHRTLRAALLQLMCKSSVRCSLSTAAHV